MLRSTKDLLSHNAPTSLAILGSAFFFVSVYHPSFLAIGDDPTRCCRSDGNSNWNEERGTPVPQEMCVFFCILTLESKPKFPFRPLVVFLCFVQIKTGTTVWVTPPKSGSFMENTSSQCGADGPIIIIMLKLFRKRDLSRR